MEETQIQSESEAENPRLPKKAKDDECAQDTNTPLTFHTLSIRANEALHIEVWNK